MRSVPILPAARAGLLSPTVGAVVNAPLGGRVTSMASDPLGPVAYLSLDTDEVIACNADTLDVQRVPMGAPVTGIAVDRDGSRLFVSSGTTIFVLSLPSLAPLGTITASQNVRGLVAGRPGRLYGSGLDLAIFDTDALAELRPLSNPTPVGCSTNRLSSSADSSVITCESDSTFDVTTDVPIGAPLELFLVSACDAGGNDGP